MSFEEKVRLLRKYELLVYSICRTLLVQERRAETAAKEALLELFRDESFGNGREDERSRIARDEAVKQSLLQYSTKRGFAHAID